MARFEPEIISKIDKDFLTHSKNIFIYPTNEYRKELDNPIFEHLKKWTNAWGFLVTRKPNKYNKDKFYSKQEYIGIFITNIQILLPIVFKAKELGKNIYIFKMDNDPVLWEEIIKPGMEKKFENTDNVIFLWEK
jgi:hypothetical protein